MSEVQPLYASINPGLGGYSYEMLPRRKRRDTVRYKLNKYTETLTYKELQDTVTTLVTDASN